MEDTYKFDPNLKIEPDHYSGGIPVFKPKYEEFKDFYKFNKAINKYGMETGVVKVIPPKEWLQSVSKNYTRKNLESIKIKNPIVQQINGSGNGIFSQQNIERARTYNIFQWKSLSEKSNHQPPASRRKLNKESNEKKPNEKTHDNSNDTNRRQTRSGGHNNKSTNELNHKTTGSEYNINVEDFDTERCEQLEKTYWKSLTYAEPMYGADSMGTLFSQKLKYWNVAHLPNLLDLMDVKLPGVNDAYLYAGLWKATFAWHLEDQDLYSINYLHFGAPKQWYSIPQSESENFFNVMKDVFPEEYKNCHDFLRHKTFLVSPQFLDKHNIKYNKIIHREKEFMITYPYGYHAGFNYGYNLAESVNFALDDWFPIAERTSKCECISDSVGINVKELYCKFKGIPYEVPDLTSDNGEDGEDENTLDHLDYNQPIKTVDHTKKLNKSPKKLKVNTNNSTISKPKETSTKRSRSNDTSSHSNPIKKPKSEVQPASHQSDQSQVLNKNTSNCECYLCPNNLPKDLLKSYQFELINTEIDGIQVHRICGTLFPNELTFKNDKILGILNISKAQKNLKCLYCGERTKGAGFQCTYGRCVRAYHGTCSINDGVLLDHDNGEFICKFHRPKYSGAVKVDPTLLSCGTLVQFKKDSKQYSSGIIQNNLPAEQKISILKYPELTETIDLEYNDLIICDGIYQGQFFKNKKDTEPKIKPEKVSKILLEDKSVTGLSQENLDLTKHENFLIEVIKGKFPSTKFKEIWYNLPNYSNDQIDRYTNDFYNPNPNDPVYLKQLSRKKKAEGDSNLKQIRPKSEPNIGMISQPQPSIPPPSPGFQGYYTGCTTAPTGVPIGVPASVPVGAYQAGPPPSLPPVQALPGFSNQSYPTPQQVPQQSPPGSTPYHPSLPPLYNFITKPRTPV